MKALGPHRVDGVVVPRRSVLRLGASAAGALALGLVSPWLAPHAHAQAQARRPAEARWVAAWAVAPVNFLELRANPLLKAAAPRPAGDAFENETLRQQFESALSGDRVRIRFSNRFGKTPLHIGAASVALGTGAGAVSPASLRALRFGGRAGTVIAPGAEAWSDGVAFKVEAGQAVAVSAFFERAAPFATVHLQAPGASWVLEGYAVASATPHGVAPLPLSHVVTGLDVRTTGPARVVVAFGDSITAGGGESGDGAYPDMLATRLRGGGNAGEAPVSVLNLGIGGNRLLVDGIGPSGLSRFAADALGQSGATHVIVLLGTNDIGRSVFPAPPGPPTPPSQVATAGRITEGLAQLIKAAREKGVKVLIGTVPPFRNTPYFGENTEAMRAEVNRWIRSRQDVDAVIDFDAVLRDPADPLALNPAYDNGDHLHPSRAGHAAMADAVDLRELQE